MSRTLRRVRSFSARSIQRRSAERLRPRLLAIIASRVLAQAPARNADGTLGYRCPGEPEEQFVSKGGRLAETRGRNCVCNGLLSTIGLGQLQDGEYHEPALLTAGDDVKELARFLPPEQETCHAADVIRHLLGSAHCRV